MRKTTTLLFLLPFLSFSQPLNYKGSQGGTFSIGMRTTLSTFNSHHDEGNGLGVGGQFRIRFSDRVNSDWFFDYIQSDIGDFASRTDYHIGWSVLYYLTNPDFSNLFSNYDRENSTDRLSSAVQGGAGVHLNLTQRWDMSFVAQYMVHLGNEVHAEFYNGQVIFPEVKGSSMEGHMLFHVGVNYKIGDLW